MVTKKYEITIIDINLAHSFIKLTTRTRHANSVTTAMEKGDTRMQEIMRIGDTFVPADDDIKAIGHASTEITDVSKRYKTDMLAIISKGDTHSLVTQYHENDTQLGDDIIKAASLVNTMADTYNVEATEIADTIKAIVEQ